MAAATMLGSSETASTVTIPIRCRRQRLVFFPAFRTIRQNCEIREMMRWLPSLLQPQIALPLRKEMLRLRRRRVRSASSLFPQLEYPPECWIPNPRAAPLRLSPLCNRGNASAGTIELL